MNNLIGSCCFIAAQHTVLRRGTVTEWDIMPVRTERSVHFSCTSKKPPPIVSYTSKPTPQPNPQLSAPTPDSPNAQTPTIQPNPQFSTPNSPNARAQLPNLTLNSVHPFPKPECSNPNSGNLPPNSIPRDSNLTHESQHWTEEFKRLDRAMPIHHNVTSFSASC